MLTGLRRSLGIFQNVYNIRIYLACAIHQKGEKDPTKNIKKKNITKLFSSRVFTAYKRVTTYRLRRR